MDTLWGSIKAFVYLGVFGLAGYAVVVNDRELINGVLPFVLAICGWWFWKDMSASFGRWQRDREIRATIVNQRLDQLQDRVAALEDRLDRQSYS